MKCICILSIVTFISLSAVSAQTVKDFSLQNAANGKMVSLQDFKSSAGVAIIFTSNVCPFSVYYEGRITQLVADYKNKGIQFILINSHLESKESETEMANKWSAWGIRIPYLIDKDQAILTALGARKSPEVFLLKNSGGNFEIYYKGSIDNNPQVASDVKDQYLKDNIDLMLQGKPAKSGGRPIGCMVKRN